MTLAIRTITRLQDADDAPALGAGQNGYALTWNNATGAFVATALFTGGLLATGATTGATSQAQTFTNGVIAPTWKPASDSTTAMQLQTSNGTALLVIDTTKRIIEMEPALVDLAVNKGAFNVSPVFSATTANINSLCGLSAQPVVNQAGGNFSSVSGLRTTVSAIGASGTVSTLSGNSVSSINNAGGTVTSLYGVNVALVSNAGGGTVTSTLAGIYIAPISTNPTVGCSNYGLLIGSVTANSSVPARNYAIQTSDGLVVFNQGGNANSDFRVEGDTDAWLLFTDASADFVGIGLSAPGSKLHVLLNDDATNAVTNVVTIGHDTTSTAAAGFGAGLEFDLESSTTAAQSAARVQALWYEATHASRKADLVLTAYDTSEREGLRIRGAGSAPAIGFLGATPQARIAHVADPSGGATVDAEARSAINSILSTLELFGFHAAS